MVLKLVCTVVFRTQTSPRIALRRWVTQHHGWLLLLSLHPFMKWL